MSGAGITSRSPRGAWPASARRSHSFHDTQHRRDRGIHREVTMDPFAELGGLRRLAVSIARDEADADDLLQDVAVIALEHPPKQDRPARPWLAKVIVNRWRMEPRASRRRRAREAGGPPGGAGPIDPPARAQMLHRPRQTRVRLPRHHSSAAVA